MDKLIGMAIAWQIVSALGGDVAQRLPGPMASAVSSMSGGGGGASAMDMARATVEGSYRPAGFNNGKFR